MRPLSRFAPVPLAVAALASLVVPPAQPRPLSVPVLGVAGHALPPERFDRAERPRQPSAAIAAHAEPAAGRVARGARSRSTVATARAVDQDAWSCVRRRESGGNYRAATGNGYFGALQWRPSTWDGAVRGLGLPEYANGRADWAPPSVQDAAGAWLQARRGWGPWPATSRACGLR